MKNFRPWHRLSKLLFIFLGSVAILLAVALGVFRLLVAQIPSYQEEIKSWVSEELELEVGFAGLDARLGLNGPELTLHNASIGSGREFLQAEQATVTLDPLTLILRRQVEISGLILEGVMLTVERDASGVFRLGDSALGSGGALTDMIPGSVQVAIRDSELRYIDVVRAEVWTFGDLDIVLDRTDGGTVARGSLVPPASLAASMDFALNLRPSAAADEPEAWTLNVSSEALDLAALSRLLPVDTGVVVTGTGDVEAELAGSGSQLRQARMSAGFSNLGLGDDEPYERIDFVADWQQLAGDDWSLALSEIDISRQGRDWAPSGTASFSLASDAGGFSGISLTSDFLRLEDLRPVIDAFPESQLAEQWALFEPGGDISNLVFALELSDEALDYFLSAVFTDIRFSQVGSTPGIDGISGSVDATEASGTIRFDSREFSLDWPTLFRNDLAGQSLLGDVVWRQQGDVVRVISAGLTLGIVGREAWTSFDLILPRDGSSPTLDLNAELDQADLVAGKQFLPTKIMPVAVVDWLDRAVVGGQGRQIRLDINGPLRNFPFDDGSGSFVVMADLADATLDYMAGWPQGTNIDGWIEFENAGFRAGAAGESLGNRTENFELAIPDMRSPVLELAFDASGSLADVVSYLRSAPLIAERLGPGFDRVEIEAGLGNLSADLSLPLQQLSAFRLDAGLEVIDGGLTVRGLRPAFTEVSGRFSASESTVSAEDIDGFFVGGPVTLSLSPSERPGYRAELVIDGETSVTGLADAFALPRTEFLDGQALWSGRLNLPALDPLATSQPTIELSSNLAGVALRFPEPFAKPPSEPLNLTVDLAFGTGNRLDVIGNLGATRRFALGFDVSEERFEFIQGAVVFGGAEPQLPFQPGLRVGGMIQTVELDRWLALSGEAGFDRAGPVFLGADVEIANLLAFGQQLGTTSLRVVRGVENWDIDIDSEAIAGAVTIPRNGLRQNPIIAEMSRIYLAGAGEGELEGFDPKTLPGIRIEADEFGFGNRELGRMTATVDPYPNGLVLSEFESSTDNYAMSISGSWLADDAGVRTSLEAEITSSDVAGALAELGLDTVLEGESAEVSANIHWDAAPTGSWLDHLNGDVNIYVETGTLREIDPGAGRVLGLMSIAALPRRLALDFRDVFEEGFAFDEISGSFRLIDGNAYTNDLKFGGPAAEIGVVGRTGLRTRDYRQQIVVAPEPSNMLPTVGGLLGGAGVGAALLIFTRLFKEPLKSIGRASYCLTGDWEAPLVERIDENESAEAARCAELPDEMLPEAIDE